MLQSQEEERKRIARDLHDDFGARLSTLKHFMQTLDKRSGEAPQDISKNAAKMVDSTIAELRNILMNLSPKALDENGLKAPLEELFENLNRLLPISAICKTFPPDCPKLPNSRCTAFARNS